MLLDGWTHTVLRTAPPARVALLVDGVVWIRGGAELLSVRRELYEALRYPGRSLRDVLDAGSPAKRTGDLRRHGTQSRWRATALGSAVCGVGILRAGHGVFFVS